MLLFCGGLRGEGSTGLASDDVSEKSIPTGLRMMLSRVLQKVAADCGAALAAALAEVKAVLKWARALLTYVLSARHESPQVVRSDGSVDATPRLGGVEAGMLLGAESVDKMVRLFPEETAMADIDGAAGAQYSSGDRFGLKRLPTVVATLPPSSAWEATASGIRAGWVAAAATQPFDVPTRVALRRGA